MIRTLLFLPDDGRRWWLRLGSDGSASRGDGWPDAADPASPSETIAVVPGDHVALHWVDLPPVAPAQTLAAARLLAADVSAREAVFKAAAAALREHIHAGEIRLGAGTWIVRARVAEGK